MTSNDSKYVSLRQFIKDLDRWVIFWLSVYFFVPILTAISPKIDSKWFFDKKNCKFWVIKKAPESSFLLGVQGFYEWSWWRDSITYFHYYVMSWVMNRMVRLIYTFFNLVHWISTKYSRYSPRTMIFCVWQFFKNSLNFLIILLLLHIL